MYSKKDNEKDDFNYGLNPKIKRLYSEKLRKHSLLLK